MISCVIAASLLTYCNPFCKGDVNFDGLVDVNDLQVVIDAYNRNDLGDADCDGWTDINDLNVVLMEWGNTCSFHMQTAPIEDLITVEPAGHGDVPEKVRASHGDVPEKITVKAVN